MSMNELFDDDIDIFLRDLDSQEKEREHFSQRRASLNQENPKTHQTRKQSGDLSKQSSKRYNAEKIKDYKPRSEISNLMKIQEGAEYREIQKKEKNRLAAKQSRDRKKLYIQLMENEHRKLDQDLSRVQEEILDTKKKISKFVSENKILTGFNTLSQLENKFDRLLSTKASPDIDVQINTMLDSMRYRLGATGKERVRKVNQFFKQIINLSLPPVLRYLVWDSTEKKHLFGSRNQGDSDQFYGELLKYVPQMPSYNSEFLKIGPRITQKKDGLITTLKHLNHIKSQLKIKCNSIQDQIDDIRQILTPTQCLHLLMIINKKRYTEDINYLNAKFMDEGEPLLSFPRKRVKLDHPEMQIN